MRWLCTHHVIDWHCQLTCKSTQEYFTHVITWWAAFIQSLTCRDTASNQCSCLMLSSVSTWMGDHWKCVNQLIRWYVISHPGQLNLVIPPIVNAMNNNDSWGVKRHTTWCTSPISMVLQCKLVSGWGLNMEIIVTLWALWLRREMQNSNRNDISKVKMCIALHENPSQSYVTSMEHIHSSNSSSSDAKWSAEASSRCDCSPERSVLR